MHTKTWNIDVYLSERDGKTHAEAVLRTHEGTEMRHTGVASKSPKDLRCRRSATSWPSAAPSAGSSTTSWTLPSSTCSTTTPPPTPRRSTSPDPRSSSRCLRGLKVLWRALLPN